MHLLNVHTRKLEYFLGSSVPEYAILSHTWGPHEANGRWPRTVRVQTRSHERRHLREPGHAKIDNCCHRAKQDGLDYVWVDTCCIDKRSSAELSEAINSMFSWYAKAAVCYVYLVDVHPSRQLQEVKCSRWFARGWTLQELIAPQCLAVFDVGWNFIGPRLTALLAHSSGIPLEFLWDEDFWHASVAQRLSWACNRETTRKEDIAYCLLGIFRVSMPLLYGEGSKAFERLQKEIINISSDQTIFAF
ncbi:heterokaryon incompatibility protein-domain-containing protein, partial [Microdochium trichocladiopsis]